MADDLTQALQALGARWEAIVQREQARWQALEREELAAVQRSLEEQHFRREQAFMDGGPDAGEVVHPGRPAEHLLGGGGEEGAAQEDGRMPLQRDDHVAQETLAKALDTLQDRAEQLAASNQSQVPSQHRHHGMSY